MTHVSREDVLHLAQLSNLQLEDAEIDTLQANVGATLDYVEKLGELDTEGIEPTYQVTDLENISRNDNVIDYQVSREQLLTLAPEQANHQIKVPKVL